MKSNELLRIKSCDTGFAIVSDTVFIGSPDDDSENHDVVISRQNDIINVNEYPLTPAMVHILKMYLDNQI
ncbi:hypothetical protein N180_02925 [Pedobacter antarcticus 4BY]|uniref:Uncharacterized protein n=2 Tax=Pedobacter antarcticus TaxID=34086 RepID=A0A081PKJ4_9SPHI|nr:hypothetical protein [Pedobacter antarcticus]KEQ31217.1 hypothetical protein N180_02925 [Pedobacter antarcticus 4BY]SFE55295.1 hypothetical protein SAMN03003324_00871 [Pedobacter antarcticus]